MTTKEQERKALEQIRKIVEGLGTDSYIATAFDGCFEIAEENIENDFALSMKGRWEKAVESWEDCSNEAIELMKKVDGLENRVKLAEQTMKQEADRANNAWNRVKELNDQLKEAVDDACRAQVKTADIELKLKDKDEEIIRLKAKLYDLMTKEG